MKWLWWVLAGPTLWSVVFVAVYSAHGAVCAPIPGPEGLTTGARLLLIGIWILGVVAFWPLLRAAPTGAGRAARLPRWGAWIGFFATVFTLFPVVFTTSC